MSPRSKRGSTRLSLLFCCQVSTSAARAGTVRKSILRCHPQRSEGSAFRYKSSQVAASHSSRKNQQFVANSPRMNTYVKSPCNPCRMNTYKFLGLKVPLE